jgi:hypothetical protein
VVLVGFTEDSSIFAFLATLMQRAELLMRLAWLEDRAELAVMPPNPPLTGRNTPAQVAAAELGGMVVSLS